MVNLDSKAFYDDLAEFYDLIFEDWDVSMQRQGTALAGLIARLAGSNRPLRVLDVAAGIGTQSLPLAQLGFELTCRDQSPAAIARLQREARTRNLSLDAGVADMRSVGKTVSGPFDVTIAFDNALAHLLTDADLRTTFRELFTTLRPGGVCLFSVRDYDKVARGEETVHAYGVRWRAGVRYLPVQVWRWLDHSHYDATFHVIAEGQPTTVRSMTAQFHAFSVARLLELLFEAGFEDATRVDETSYQPVVTARRPAAG
jgi:SAM-dependent methyltransferase